MCLMSSQSQAEGVLGLSAAELRKEVSALIINQSEPSMETDWPIGGQEIR